MKRALLLIILCQVFFNCSKNNNSQSCQDVSPESEEPQIMAFCEANNITYTKDSSGIFYQIIDPGSSVKPTLYSTVSTIYTGTYLNGTVIDQSTVPYTNKLVNLIPGWQIGLPLIGIGGHIKMVIPSSLCYGCYGVPASGLPSNTILYFDITLTDVQ